ncbi:tetratricopeptide repeat protein [Sulfurimonas sp. CS5]|uniref:tetratricopeptide repeat protein n=1 Tax=Sulfurimonas sp. CS5 TaxID=3391145 RepID=UPI0039E8438E
MAEEIEDIIIIEESDAAESDSIHESEPILDDETSKKKKIIILGLVAFLLVFIIIVVLFFILKSPDVKSNNSIDFIETKLDQNITKHIQPSKLENMISKANYLYSSGSKDEALFLYEKIAHYSEAISVYNLGVAQLKDGTYDLALKTFKKAIVNDEKRCVSAINAAVCSLHLKDEKSFNYYIDLAYAYLAKEKNSPLYSYYYALINYYNNNYLEALSALENPTSNEYPTTQKHLRAKINALYSNDYKAIEAMEKDFQAKDSFSIAMLYARVGDLTLSQKHLEEAIIKNIQPVKSAVAQALINLKAGQVTTASKQIKNVTDMFPEEVYKPYPISVTLKESLFDPLKAQLKYRDRIKHDRIFNYLKIFYFSPYKIFNADRTISYIQKGNANIYIDNISSAKEYLKRGASASTVNKGIVKAIKKALAFKLRESNSDLQKLVKLQPKHSILHYNLALTYAQMGNIIKAHKHFLLSYHLDAKNYLSGIFAVMTSQLINKDSTKLATIVKDSISLEEPSEKIDLYKTLMFISDNNIILTADWLDKDYKQRPLYLAMDTIIALGLNNIAVAKKASHKLTILLPNEILPHMMYIDSYFSELKPKEYAKKVLNYLKLQTFNFNDLYYGPYITRYLYTQQNLITGKLYFLRKQLRDVLETTNENTQEITSALALASLYDKAFEESYTLYNNLIDDLKVRDAYTLFLGAVASTAADHHANAIALLELSKMKDGSFLESRYALGLLYLEVKNNQGAVIQFGRIGDNGFSSEYFNFDINLDKLLFEKEQAALK